MDHSINATRGCRPREAFHPLLGSPDALQDDCSALVGVKFQSGQVGDQEQHEEVRRMFIIGLSHSPLAMGLRGQTTGSALINNILPPMYRRSLRQEAHPRGDATTVASFYYALDWIGILIHMYAPFVAPLRRLLLMLAPDQFLGLSSVIHFLFRELVVFFETSEVLAELAGNSGRRLCKRPLSWSELHCRRPWRCNQVPKLLDDGRAHNPL
ncbi:hypothetical protein BV22DRAFT_838671 [Leucogyrophana mollusca]|uniref:Uncharacterized protein n=1 Tax=Leucogyrophana mollusca TaxID=85980 RepID=A0ACB8B3B2_9AGAM|nr:hypothetical protein BV22DRAFT_838671 [Leucogyrophana mollusca]